MGYNISAEWPLIVEFSIIISSTQCIGYGTQKNKKIFCLISIENGVVAERYSLFNILVYSLWKFITDD